MPDGSFSLTISHSAPAGLQPGQHGQVDRRLGVAGPAQHAAVAGAQRHDVPGSGQVGRVGRSGSASSRIVWARSVAEMPVDTPSRASTVTAYAVPRRSWLTRNIGGRSSRSASDSVIGTQM